MPRRLLFALLLLVAAPLALLGWFSASAYHQQQQEARQRLTRLYTGRLAEIDQTLRDVFLGYERRLRATLNNAVSDEAVVPVEALRRLDRTEPIVRTTLWVDRHGVLLHPSPPGPEDSDKVALFASLPTIIASRPAPGDRPEDRSDSENTPVGGDIAPSKSVLSNATEPTPPLAKVSPFSSRPLGQGSWQTWYMGQGLQLIYWIPLRDGGTVGVVLQRARWIADLTAALPDTALPLNRDLNALASSQATELSGITSLRDETDQLIYRWGYSDADDTRVLASRPLSAPLRSWKLQYASSDPLSHTGATAMIASLSAIAVILLSLGGYVVTTVQREMRTAKQRVSFASQVSHELRTPLTNIRLYTELAESDLQKLENPHARQLLSGRLHVIETETRRLSRLVSGVLELIRDPKKSKGLRLQSQIPDEVIDQTLRQFAPSFENNGLKLDRHSGASTPAEFDADLLELILVNLLSNVEKYAAHGEQIEVRSAIIDHDLVIHVCDFGPGIPKRYQRDIFRAFWRLDDSISAPAGTGIGLTIAQRLAERHGGELKLIDAPPETTAAASARYGACFELRLRVNPPSQPSSQ